MLCEDRQNVALERDPSLGCIRRPCGARERSNDRQHAASDGEAQHDLAPYYLTLTA